MADLSRTLLGFDYGKKRIGVAVGQEITGSAQPLVTVHMVQNKPDWDHITRLLEQWKPDLLIVGEPKNMDDTENDMTRAARRFANQLNGRYNLPIALVDERLTSMEAEEIITEQRRAGRIKKKSSKAALDQVAAQLILQTWLYQ